MSGGDTRGLVRTDVVLINHFVWWFQAISVNMNAEAQRRALSASHNAACSVFTDEGDDEGSSNVVKVAPVQGGLIRVEYSAEMAEIGFIPQNRDQRDCLRE